MANAGIAGSGIYLPKSKVGNAELEEILGLEAGFIELRTGITERRWSSGDETVEHMASQAALNAVEDAGIDKVDQMVIARDLISTRRAHSLGLPIMQELERIGIDVSDCSSVDLCNYCPGFVHGVNIAQLMVRGRQAKNVIVVASTDYTSMISRDDQFNQQFGDSFDSTKSSVFQYSLGSEGQFQPPVLNAFLWGCGAGAVVVGETDEDGIRCFRARASKKLRFNSFGIGEATDGNSFGSLDGKAIYRYALTEVPRFIDDFLKSVNLAQQDIDVLIPHQPNPRILRDLSKRLEIPGEKILVSCNYLGNMIAASVPITYHLGRKSGKIKTGDNVLLCSFGDSYLTTSALVFREM